MHTLFNSFPRLSVGTQNFLSFNKKTFLLIMFAFFIGVLGRLLWIFFIDSSYDIFKWHGEFVPTTIDTYYWGSIIQNALYKIHSLNPKFFHISIYNDIISLLGFVLAKFSSFSLETILFYSPAIIGSLIVIPLFFIGRLLFVERHDYIGFSSAIYGVLGWSYFNRTTVGYYDTDMFSITLPIVIGYFLLKSIKERNISYSLAAALSIYCYNFFYSAGLVIAYALIISYFFYLFLFHRNEEFSYKSIILLCSPFIFLPEFSILGFSFKWLLKIIFIIIIFSLLKNIKLKKLTYYSISIIFFLFFIIAANPFRSILYAIIFYLSRGYHTAMHSDLKFLSVIGTVQEAQYIDFSKMAVRISGSLIGFLIGFAGYVFMFFKKRDFFLIMLPIVGVGLFSLNGGLRFTIYAVPVFAVSSIYIIHYFSKKFLKNRKIALSVFFLSVFFIVFPNIKHVIEYRPVGCFDKHVIEALNYLKNNNDDKNAYALTWWDYGTSIWYYSGLNTLSSPGDNGKNVNFSVSHIFSSSSQRAAANLSRILVEDFSQIAKTQEVYPANFFEYILKKDNKDKKPDPNRFLKELESSFFKLPDKTCDIYLYLPHNMLYIMNKVALFSNRDLLTGIKKHKMTLSIINKVKQTGDIITLENGLSINTKDLSATYSDGSVFNNIKAFYSVYYKDDKLTVAKRGKDIAGYYNIVYYQPLDSFLFMDDNMLNSNFIQLYIFNNYDPNLFEPVYLTPAAKIYKLKV